MPSLAAKSHLKSRIQDVLGRKPPASPWDDENAIREEIFSAERLEEHARSLALAQTVTKKPKRNYPLADRLADNAAVLLAAHRNIIQTIDEGRSITPAAEWLVDNFHVIEKQIAGIRSDLPPGYYRQLPKLGTGPFADYPRVFGLTWAFVAHTDSNFDPVILCRFVRAYQEVQPLTIGELWAVAITLRIVLVENLRRLAERIVGSRVARRAADDLANRLLGTSGHAAEPVSQVLADYENAAVPDAFAVQLIHRLRDQDVRILPALTWLEDRLAVRGTTADAVVRDEHHRQGAATVTVRNIITSMRLISDVEWTELFERISLVDDILGTSAGYSEMDFPTRSLYRSAIEELARGSKHTEIDIARDAVLAARRASSVDTNVEQDRRGDPGYYLLGGGRRGFERGIGFRPTVRTWLGRWTDAIGIVGYVGAGMAVAIGVLALPLAMLSDLGGAWLFLLALAGLVPAIDAAVALVNRSMMHGFGATLLPAMELREGIPSHFRTMVVVPTLLTNHGAIEKQIERLEIHHLSSPEGDLQFALLSDWLDAATEVTKDDTALLTAAIEGIARLNRRYGPAPGGQRFLLLHRRRVWNQSEGRWIGWERKRGKLHELNRILRGATDTTFITTQQSLPPGSHDVRYVVTLDADTKLPRDTVRRLIGKMAHPLNRPRFDPQAGRVVEGYAVLQPRVTPLLPIGRKGSLFQRVFSSRAGFDPYAAAVSDVYQDLFGEGSYAGKGIYDVDLFEAALAGRVPDSTLLSHDLFEGVFARAGLASDIEFVEEFPSRYDVAALRHHRWARGDWQLLPWIMGFGVRGRDAGRGNIPSIGRWKMIDNLRRSVSPPAAVIALLAGWALPIDQALIWTSFILATILLPGLISIAGSIVPRRAGTTLRSHFRALGSDLRLALTLFALQVTFLAHQGWLMGDAILRTLVRLLLTRRHLLEWVTAAQTSTGPRPTLGGFYYRMGAAPGIAALALCIPWIAGANTWSLAVPFAALWAASPAIARWASLSPPVAGRLSVTELDAKTLRLTARRTWRFFETFVTVSDNMLPPDNFQEDPVPVIAHRTSPTNIGLYLLSTVSARDFGWTGTKDAVERLEATLESMKGLERFRGHFYNWYDTEDLRPLDPPYISSVDSGNLAGHLIALANACSEWRRTQPADAARFTGIVDAIDLAREEATRVRAECAGPSALGLPLEIAFDALSAGLRRRLSENEYLEERLSQLSLEAGTIAGLAHDILNEQKGIDGKDLLFWTQAIQKTIASHRRDLQAESADGFDLDRRLSILENTARSFALAMEFDFLLDEDRKLLSIGYLVREDRLDPSCYDLLASEARLASFMAIAKSDVPTRHWYRLGRAVTPIAHGAALISWSGSMFEYLMPSLVMRAPTGSLIEQTSRLIVRYQIEYARARGIPWGISESAYNARDIEFTYQYSNFGVAGLGLKRGLGENSVIAPYATALASMVDPTAAAHNFERLNAIGARGRFGFYEALDYSPARVPAGKTFVIVRAFMAHHQGMTIVAIADALLDGAMRGRFHAEPIVQATELLLQERTPRDVAIPRSWVSESKTPDTRDIALLGSRRFNTAHGATPATHLLSNGRYAVMLTAAGSGYSRWQDISLTRWREDATCDSFGSHIFLRDVRSGKTWSAGFQPSGVAPDAYDVVFKEDRAEFARRDGTLTTTMEVLVSAEDDAEVRRVSISNSGPGMREIEVTSYKELVLASQAADVAHPAFSKLFVETEYLAESGAILATRRRRTPAEPEIWVGHLAVVDGETSGEAQIETDRASFLGRGNSVRNPISISDGKTLSNTVGIVLDPIFALRRRVRIAPGAIVRIAFWTMATPSRAAMLDIVDKHRDATAFERASTLAWTQAQVQLHHLGLERGEAALFQRLAGHILYATPTLRASSDAISRGAGGQPGLWNLSISGDLPILLLRVAEMEDIAIARQILRAREYWLTKQLAVDIVLLNERSSSYVQDVQIALEGLVRASQARSSSEAAGPLGRVFVVRSDLTSMETRNLLISVARVVLVGQRGTLADQIDHARAPVAKTPVHSPRQIPAPPNLALPPRPIGHALEFFNGIGGFAKDGKEYVTVLGPGQRTPAPWINVIANPKFGFHVAAEGGGYTWSVNSRENQLTPWSNDPVSDQPGEALYLRDEDSGDVWSPTAQPMRNPSGTYVARHGRGYSRFEHSAHEIDAILTQFVALEDPVKISRLMLVNRSNRSRRISLTTYAEWVLGPSRGATAPFVTTAMDTETGAIFARNSWNPAFAARVAFADCRGQQSSWSGDRREFIGRNGALSRPASLFGAGSLSNTVGAGLDPCAALRTLVELPPGGTVEIVSLLGEAPSAEAARKLVLHYRKVDLDGVQSAIAAHWHDVLDMVHVKTPDRSMDIMLNGWLLYQTLSCRIWARSAFYQASGAYGFRDQLQDGMSIAVARPKLTRAHLLHAAGRQFLEGDVQHWWLPHSGLGVRTRISDDRAWLAYAVNHYVDVTGDDGILDVSIPFLEGPRLREGEHDSLFQPTISDESATLFEHCARGLDNSLAIGSHGLPLIGTGDWNDGMNRVGEHGRGESVWLGWILHAMLTRFAAIADARFEPQRAMNWRAHAASLKTALERDGWDGEWYRRGYFDDGTPFGSAASEECRIDSIAQSWAVLSGAGDPGRAIRGMQAVQQNLIRPDDGLALLFTPPFDKTPLDPGYIKGYPPGIRENGGQYTHAALWSLMALAQLGDGDKAGELFSLLNPINHAHTEAGMQRYKVEPYVVAADIYSVPPHVGRGGWTWYTGAAGWMQRAGVESILGLRVRGDTLSIDPCIPRAWPGFEMRFRYRSTFYDIHVDNAEGVNRGIAEATLDDALIETRPLCIPLLDDGAAHVIRVRMG